MSEQTAADHPDVCMLTSFPLSDTTLINTHVRQSVSHSVTQRHDGVLVFSYKQWYYYDSMSINIAVVACRWVDVHTLLSHVACYTALC